MRKTWCPYVRFRYTADVEDKEVLHLNRNDNREYLQQRETETTERWARQHCGTF